jgi:hypothetical protein
MAAPLRKMVPASGSQVLRQEPMFTFGGLGLTQSWLAPELLRRMMLS